MNQDDPKASTRLIDEKADPETTLRKQINYFLL